MSDDQFNQLRQMLSSVDARLSNLEQGQQHLEQGQQRLETRLKDHQEESTKEHGELGDYLGGLAGHTDESIAAAQKKTVQVLSERVSTVLQHQDKRITRLEKNAGLSPLE